MEEYLFVDGYNIINAWPDLNRLKDYSFEDARLKLLEILLDYQGLSGRRIIVVFDAHQVKGGREKSELYQGLEVVFTRENETADMYIERRAGDLAIKERVFVATSDAIEQSVSMQRGALRMSARELAEEIKYITAQNKEHLKNKGQYFGNIHQNLPAQVKETLEKWRRGKA